MRTFIVTLAAAVMAVCLLAAGWAVGDRFDQGTKKGAVFRAEICHSENQIRRILHTEHLKKLRLDNARVRDTEKFIADGRTIPGITRQELLTGLDRAQDEARDEAETVRQTKQKACT